MHRIYMHVTRQMRKRLCEAPEELWQDILAGRYKVNKHSHAPPLDHLLRARETSHAPPP
jgi:hypothetical protein